MPSLHASVFSIKNWTRPGTSELSTREKLKCGIHLPTCLAGRLGGTYFRLAFRSALFLIFARGWKVPSALETTSLFAFAYLRARSVNEEWIQRMNWIMGNLFSFEHFRGFSHNLATNIQYCSWKFSIFWKHSRNSDISSSKLIIENHKNCKFAEKWFWN